MKENDRVSHRSLQLNNSRKRRGDKTEHEDKERKEDERKRRSAKGRRFDYDCEEEEGSSDRRDEEGDPF